MAEKIYRDEVLGGDGKRWYALVAPDGKVLLEKFSIEKSYEPQRQGSMLCAEDVNAMIGALGQKMEAGDFLAQASAKAEQADLQSAQAEAQKKLLRIQENLNARIFSNSLTAGDPGFNQWVYAQGEGGTQIPNAPESGTLWYLSLIHI